MELVSLYTVPLSAVNGLSRLTKLTMSKGASTADLKIFELANHFRIESDGRFEFESSQVPCVVLWSVPFSFGQ